MGMAAVYGRGKPNSANRQRTRMPYESSVMKKQALSMLLVCSVLSSLAAFGSAAEPGVPEGFRHAKPGAVFRILAVKWNSWADADAIEKACQTLATLPENVPGVVDVSWGKNNSPEPHSRGFQNCFIATFENKAALDAFARDRRYAELENQIRDLTDDGICVDVVSDKEHTWYDGQVKHVVLFKYKWDAKDEQIEATANAFKGLPMKVPGVCDFLSGVNAGPADLSQGLDHVFVVTFENETRRDEYLPHPAHAAFGKVLGPIFNEVFVIDFTVVPRG